MGRKSLLFLIKRSFKNIQLSVESGLPIEEIRERNSKMVKGLTRRQFLIGATAVATCSALPEIIWPKLLSSDGPRIAIIGGGLAGLAAAVTLADAGLAFTVYEASETMIGGRMQTVRPSGPSCSICHDIKDKGATNWADGQYIDIFGEMIDSNHYTMLSLCKRFNLPLIDLISSQPDNSTDTYYFMGQYYPMAQFYKDFSQLYPRLREDLNAAGYPTTYNRSTPAGRILDSMSVYDWIESRVLGGHNSPMGRLLDIAYNIEYGAETTDQSALNLIYMLAYNNPKSPTIYGESDERYRIVGGADRLPKAMFQYIGGENTVRFGWKLESIERLTDGRYLLLFNRRRSIKADFVILAFPFAVLRDLDFSRAGFDTLKIKAIREKGAGKDGKLHLQFTSRYWNQQGPWGVSNGSTFSDTGYQCTWESTRGQLGTSGILINYTGGNTVNSMRLKHSYGDSRDARVVEDAKNFLSQIELVFPGISSYWNGMAVSTMAHLNPLWQSSYSYWRVGQRHVFAGYERVRQGNLFFAGEHTSLDYDGWMEGAVSEGIYAAKEIIRAIKTKGRVSVNDNIALKKAV